MRIDSLTAVFFHGFAVSASLIIAIGAQNAFVLQLGLRRTHILEVVLFCATFNSLCIVLGVVGFGDLASRFAMINSYLLWSGFAFLTFYGFKSLLSALTKSENLAPSPQSTSKDLAKTIGTAAAVTVLNPHLYLDTVVLLGGLGGRYLGVERIAFLSGAIAATFTWFFALGYGAKRLTPVFAKPAAWRILNAFIGITMLLIAGALVL
ncbi:MAG: LysE family transporter [Bdellovibrionota bacterium]